MSGWRLAVLAAALGSIATAARADLVVVTQEGTPYKAEQKLADEAALDVPAGARLQVRRLPEGTTVEIKGPYKGKLQDYAASKDCPWWNLLCKKTDDGTARGGVRGDPEPDTGGTRGLQ